MALNCQYDTYARSRLSKICKIILFVFISSVNVVCMIKNLLEISLTALFAQNMFKFKHINYY